LYAVDFGKLSVLPLMTTLELQLADYPAQSLPLTFIPFSLASITAQLQSQACQQLMPCKAALQSGTERLIFLANLTLND